MRARADLHAPSVVERAREISLVMVVLLHTTILGALAYQEEAKLNATGP